ncbi:MAG: UDP-glucose/GDP-mannose dehydrogenase family protein [Planctomycetota bacterium]
MKVAVIGTGYVGLVSGTCFANSGNHVTCVDINQQKIDDLKNGKIPIYEPGLTELVIRNSDAGRLNFTTDAGEAVKPADVVYLAVGTPQGQDGSADLTALFKVAESIAPHLREDAVVVTKSTVPVGTNARLYARLRELTDRECHVASNPEFLKEGAAIEDFTKPDRVVVGVRKQEHADLLHRLYKPFLRTDKPFLVMSPESAELTKYVANALLATKISFINQMANVCEKFDADINDVRRGIGHDSRIGFSFLFPGAGYGGSCFPKDVRAMVSTCKQVGMHADILEAVDAVNERQKTVLQDKVIGHFGNELSGKTFAVWGLAFKPKTDDIREAPSIVLIQKLLSLGAKVVAYDPEAMENVINELGNGDFRCVEQPMDALDGVDGLAIVTEWSQFRNPDFEQMKSRMKNPVVFDGRNLYEPSQMEESGFTYYSIGRPVRGA